MSLSAFTAGCSATRLRAIHSEARPRAWARTAVLAQANTADDAHWTLVGLGPTPMAAVVASRVAVSSPLNSENQRESKMTSLVWCLLSMPACESTATHSCAVPPLSGASPPSACTMWSNGPEDARSKARSVMALSRSRSLTVFFSARVSIANVLRVSKTHRFGAPPRPGRASTDAAPSSVSSNSAATVSASPVPYAPLGTNEAANSSASVAPRAPPARGHNDLTNSAVAIRSAARGLCFAQPSSRTVSRRRAAPRSGLC